jgi:DNA-binding NarL/FixJ family response regulator
MIKVLIYEDNPQLREGLTMLINGSEGFEVLASFKNCNNVLQEIKTYKPDVILMDIDMPGTNGIEGLKQIRLVDNETKVLMLTVFDDNKNVFEAISNGANGYVLKKTPPCKVIRIHTGSKYGRGAYDFFHCYPGLKMFSSLNNEKGEDYNLSDREKQVLSLLVNGYSYKMISAEMFIAIDTVRSHIKKIYEKLHVNSKSEAVAKAFKDKIV